MYEAIICQRAPARGPKATGLEPLEIAALGGVAACQHYSDPVALKFGLLGCTPMRGGRSVDPWKRHLPVWPEAAVQYGLFA